MTAAFDATRGTDQRFTDALSGSDGTADPSILMPVLDVYPDALSAPMPVDLVPVVLPRLTVSPQPLARADPVLGPGARQQGRQQSVRQPAVRPPAGQRGSQAALPPTQGRSGLRQPAYGQPQPARMPTGRPQPTSSRPVPLPAPGSAAAGVRPAPPMGPRPANPAGVQGRTVTAADVAAMFRNLTSGQSERIDRQSFQATHPQSMGSTAPSAVAPAAPMASQYTQRGQTRNTARDQAQERRRSSSAPKKRSSSVWAVIVFFVVIGFASGGVQKLIDLINEFLNR